MAEIRKLIEGYHEFYQEYFESGDKLYGQLSEGQSPKTLIIACSDSRVDPAIITNANPGDIFVIRNVANLVPPYEKDDKHHGVSAAVEFAVRALEVKHIVILGHSGCAGINSLIYPEKVKNMDFISSWVDIAKPAREKALDQCDGSDDESKVQYCCEQAAIELSLANLLTFPWLKEKVEASALKVHGWYFSFNDGGLYQYNPENKVFEGI